MSDALYKKSLLRLAADAHGAGSLSGADAHGAAHNPACGDRVEIDLALADGRIAALAHHTKACVLAQASASILGRHAIGRSRAEIEGLRTEIVAMLGEGAPPPSVPFATYAEFAGAAEIPGRHRCVLLPVDALLDALGNA